MNPSQIQFTRSAGRNLSPMFFAVYVICKLGNDSQKAVQVLEKMSGSDVDRITVKDVCGGLMAWAKCVDPLFPQY